MKGNASYNSATLPQASVQALAADMSRRYACSSEPPQDYLSEEEEQKARSLAARMLNRRLMCSAELLAKLQEKGCSEAAAQQAVAYLQGMVCMQALTLPAPSAISPHACQATVHAVFCMGMQQQQQHATSGPIFIYLI